MTSMKKPKSIISSMKSSAVLPTNTQSMLVIQSDGNKP